MHQSTLEYYYGIWGPSAWSLCWLIIACTGSYRILKERRTRGAWALVFAVILLTGSSCADKIGWLILSGYDQCIESSKEPWRYASFTGMKPYIEAMCNIGIASLTIAIVLMSRNLKISGTRTF